MVPVIALLNTIITAKKPYGEFTYIVDMCPLLLSILVLLVCIVFVLLYIKERPKVIVFSSFYLTLLISQSILTMMIYCYMQYRWVVLQFEQNKWLELLWAGNETLILFTIFWSVLLSIIAILHKQEKPK